MYKLSILIISIVVLISFSECNNITQEKSIALSLYAPYFRNSDSLISKFDNERIKRRESIILKLKSTELYKSLVFGKRVNSDALKTMHYTASSIIGLTKKGFTGSLQDIMLYTDDEREFSSSVCVLIGHHGGITSDIVEVFERYKKRFKLLGKKGAICYNEKGIPIDTIKADYDLSPFFAILDFKNREVLNALFESRLLSIRKWENYNSQYADYPTYPFLSMEDEYQQHLKTFYPDSKYILEYKYSGHASTLISEYQANEVAADKKFRNEGILLEGTIVRVMKDLSDNNIILLSGNNFISNVYCHVTEADALRVSRGRRIKILGRCKGMALNNVVLENCFVTTL